MIKYIFYILTFIAVAGVFCWGFVSCLTEPEVHVSYSTKKCVRIISYKGEELPCSELKKFSRYERVWVE